jgi:hypothetical protein
MQSENWFSNQSSVIWQIVMENPSKTRQYTAKDWLKWIIPVALSIIVTIVTYFHTWIETVYAAKIYPYIALVQRTITGWLPFSLGDFLYLVLGLWIFIKIFKTLRATARRKITRQKTLQRTFRLARFLLWVYIIFNLLWGWNYHRPGLDHQLQLPTGKYSSPEVKLLLEEVIMKLNENRLLLSRDSVLPAESFSRMRTGAAESYRVAAARFPFLSYSTISIKKSIYSKAAQYLGFTGYYNPFTGEAQLRTQIPEVMKPFIICHEIGHQVGYAKENEASFAGYLAASSSRDPYFRYSVYLDLYNSVRSRLLFTGFEEGDTTVIRLLPEYNKKLDTLVRFDRRKIREYFRHNQTMFSEQMSSVVMSMYEQYLKANKQSAGLKSYDDVVSLLVAYRRKYGRI